MLHARLLRVLLIAVLAVGLWGGASLPAVGQEMASYYEYNDLLEVPAATVREGLLGYANPAVPAITRNHLVGVWNTDGRRAASVRDWGVFSTVGGLSGAVVRQARGGRSVTNYHVGLAGGEEAVSVGLAYQGAAGDATALGYYNRLSTGAVVRPSKHVSLGLVGTASLETDDREVVGTLGVRPLGTSRLTLFADAAWGEGQAVRDMPWSAGATVEVVEGVDLTGRVFEGGATSVGLRVGLGRIGVGSQGGFDTEGAYAGQTTRVRVGAEVPSAIAEAVGEEGSHVTVEPTSLPYQAPRFSLRGDAGPRFYEVLRTLRQARESDRVAAVAIDGRGVALSREKAWELRRAIENAQDAGTEVVVFLEGAGMTTYHVASVADRVVMDPRGSVRLPGYAMSRTYLKRTLDTLGLGVQPFRFFEYKSAFENLTRTGFSASDSLQRQQIVNDWYRLARRNITESRNLSPDSLDRLIDETTLLSASGAKQVGLVDTLARWHQRSGILEGVTGDATSAMDADRLDAIATATQRWGATPEIAVVYGIGGTSLESGIQARQLARTFRDLAEDEDVAAVVFRVDSPGGSALAADVAAQAVKACAEAKPVIVSQGTVAASGGYLISTYADRIFAGPNTVTGSIGVIGLWVYDDGLLSDRAQFSYDVVQRGARADLFAPYRIPGLGVPVPTRKLNAGELDRAEDLIRQSYDDFVGQVAAGRDTSTAYVRSVAEGRVYSGWAGQERGLVDEIGGMSEAIAAARSAADLSDTLVTIREVNATTGLVDLSLGLPGGLQTLVGMEEASDRGRIDSPGLRFFRTVLEHQPDPLLLLPPSYYAPQ